MVITHHKIGMFRVSFGDTTLAVNPISKQSKTKTTKFGADIALISLADDDHNGHELVAHGERQPFVVRGPGEYEVQGILIKGYGTVSNYGGVERINTVYLVKIEGMLLLFLGAIGTKDLPSELKEQLDSIDVLFVPIGGEGVLGVDDAHDLAVSIEPKLIIPSHYDGIGTKDALTSFLKEDAKENGGPVEKLTIKRKDLEGHQGDVVVLTT
jgi:hypothetical protein